MTNYYMFEQNILVKEDPIVNKPNLVKVFTVTKSFNTDKKQLIHQQ